MRNVVPLTRISVLGPIGVRQLGCKRIYLSTIVLPFKSMKLSVKGSLRYRINSINNLRSAAGYFLLFLTSNDL